MYLPSEGEVMTVCLPNEMIRARVVAVLSKHVIQAVLDQAYPFTRLHGFEFGDTLKFRRDNSDPLHRERWVLHESKVPTRRKAEEARPTPRMAPPDVRPEKPATVQPPKVAKRRSEIEAERPKKGDKAHGQQNAG